MQERGSHSCSHCSRVNTWMDLGGPIEGLPSKNTQSMLSTVCIDPVTDILKQFWELESIGIVDKRNTPMSLEEEESVRQFNEGLKFDGERYEVPLLWKSDALPLKSNYLQVVKRLESVERQVRRNPERAIAYRGRHPSRTDGTSKDLCGSKHHLVVEPYEAVT